MELRDYIQILRKSWVLIVAVTLSGLLVSGIASILIAPVYTSSTSVFVAIQSAGDSGSDLNAGTTYVQNQVKSFAEVATTDRVLQPVIDQLQLSTSVTDLAKRVTASAPLDTVIITISVTDASPSVAADVANSIGTNLIDTVEELSKPASGSSPVKMSTVSPALEATSATSPNVRLNLVIGTLIGLAVGIAISVLRTVLDTRVHSERDVQLLTSASVLGGISYDDEAPDRPLVVQVNPHSPRAEAFRQLRTNLQFVELTDAGRTFVVTSSIPAEGKSSTSVNLAITIAEAGSRVLLIDGDLRRPKVAEYMGLEGAVGLTDHLIGQAKLDDVVQPWGAGNLHVLPAGQVPPNPSELLGSRAMITLLAKLDEAYDTVIIDAPPLLPVTDAAILSKLVSGGALIVVGAGRITNHQLQSAVTSLETVGGRVIGIIMNLLPVKEAGAYDYSRYYGNDLQPPAKREKKAKTSNDSSPK